MAVKPTGLLVLPDPERTAEVEIALGVHGPAHVELERGGDGAQRDAGARDERLEQHVAGASQQAGAAGRRMQPRLDEGAAGGPLHETLSSPSVPSARSVTRAAAGSSR